MRGEGSSKNFFCKIKNSFRSISVRLCRSPESGRPSPFDPSTSNLRTFRDISQPAARKALVHSCALQCSPQTGHGILLLYHLIPVPAPLSLDQSLQRLQVIALNPPGKWLQGPPLRHHLHHQIQAKDQHKAQKQHILATPQHSLHLNSAEWRTQIHHIAHTKMLSIITLLYISR